jgi:hypothetical protein
MEVGGVCGMYYRKEKNAYTILLTKQDESPSLGRP